jgi:hypothetical protein
MEVLNEKRKIMSYAEDLFEKSLRAVLGNEVEIIKNYRPVWLKNPETDRLLELDFYIPSVKVAFEIQGEHHYLKEEQKKRDLIKIKLCRNKGIKLLHNSIVGNKSNNVITEFKRVGIKIDKINNEQLAKETNTLAEAYKKKMKKGNSFCTKHPLYYKNKQTSEYYDRYAYAVMYKDKCKILRGFIARIETGHVILCEDTPESKIYKEKIIKRSQVKKWLLGKKFRTDRDDKGNRIRIISDKIIVRRKSKNIYDL